MSTAPLLLIPTDRERELLLDTGALPAGLDVHTVGFGPVASAANAARLFAGRPDGSRAILVGIAGRYPSGPGVGTAVEFGRVRIDGVGALEPTSDVDGAPGPGGRLLTPGAMGLPQWSLTDGTQVFDELALAGAGPGLLTVCAAAGSAADVAERTARAAGAAAEDMEAFGVALAARIAHVDLRVVRGISNEAGDRDHGRWRIADALQSAAELTASLLG